MYTRVATFVSTYRTQTLVILALLLAALLFILAPVDGLGLADLSSGCRQVVEGATTAGARELNCRKALVYYSEVTCAGRCAFIPILPFDAQDALAGWPGREVVSQLYVRTLNSERNPVDKWYTVCFKPNVENKVYKAGIWSYHPDTGWFAESYFRDAAGNMCHNHLGESSFVLMGWPK
jgi:hypothetical protein